MNNPHGTRYWWQSRTILGALAVLIVAAVRALAPESALTGDEVLGVLLDVTQAAGAVLAILGRVWARERIRPEVLPGRRGA